MFYKKIEAFKCCISLYIFKTVLDITMNRVDYFIVTNPSKDASLDASVDAYQQNVGTKPQDITVIDKNFLESILHRIKLGGIVQPGTEIILLQPLFDTICNSQHLLKIIYDRWQSVYNNALLVKKDDKTYSLIRIIPNIDLDPSNSSTAFYGTQYRRNAQYKYTCFENFVFKRN